MVKENENAIDFTLKNFDGNDISLSQFKGKKIVLYFYPKDNTPGCTTKACGFRAAYDL
ncbi:MAG TPA: redoxin domain-containing protein, partial [Spirochaetota bacterium]|nr:redoxin domain-containing protein [Spirochaetota bacterium]